MRVYVYIFAFLFSIATILLQRGVYFFTKYELGMTELQNLLLALVIGVTYIAGAKSSHRFSGVFGERRLVCILILPQMFFPLLAFFMPSPAVVSSSVVVTAFFNGMTWPIAESYASAGLGEKESSRSIGIYNLCWSSAIPITVLMSGFLIEVSKSGIFLVSAAVALASVPAVLFLPASAPHHPGGEASADPRGENGCSRGEMRGMMISSRWSMGFSFALMQILASLLPSKFHGLGMNVSTAAFFAVFFDVSRIAAFLLMAGTSWWHGKKNMLAFLSPVIAAGFFICMFGGSIPFVIAGEIIYGASAGIAYYAALYYAMVLSRASVGAGGSHESVIGAGFAIGPVILIAGSQISARAGLSATAGYMAGFLPMAFAAIALSAYYLRPGKFSN